MYRTQISCHTPNHVVLVSMMAAIFIDNEWDSGLESSGLGGGGGIYPILEVIWSSIEKVFFVCEKVTKMDLLVWNKGSIRSGIVLSYIILIIWETDALGKVNPGGGGAGIWQGSIWPYRWLWQQQLFPTSFWHYKYRSFGRRGFW